MTQGRHGKRSILIVGPSWVGDMVMAQSLFMTLRQQDPAVEIDVLAPAWSRPLLERMPEVRDAIDLPIGHGRFGWSARKKLGIALRERDYAQAIVLPNSWKSALIPWFARIPVRTGWRGEMRYGLLNDLRRLDKSALPLMVQRFVALAGPAGDSQSPPDYPLPRLQARSVGAETDPPRNTGQRRLVLCPGAEFGPAKQWPADYYAELASGLLQQGWQVLIMGSQGDAKSGTAICDQIAPDLQGGVFNLCGRTSLAEAIDLLDTADYVVSNDSGLMHIAAALHRPLTAIYGPTSPAFTPPLSSRAQIVQIQVDCGPCFKRECPLGHHRCMRDILPDTIAATIRDTPDGDARQASRSAHD